MQVDFCSRIKNSRFLEIQRAVGAWQGRGVIQPNQLLDAFAIWCAEFNKCDAFLTLDFKLAKMARDDPKHRVIVPILRPSEVLSRIENLPNAPI
jgi:hypothetical protein